MNSEIRNPNAAIELFHFPKSRIRLPERCSQRLLVNYSGQMNRTFAVYRVPAGRVRRAKILDIQANAHQGISDGQVDDARSGFPGCAAGRPFQDFNGGYPAL